MDADLTDPLLPLPPPELAWLSPFMDATTPDAVAAAITAAITATCGDCRDIRVLWALESETAPAREPAGTSEVQSDEALALASLADLHPRFGGGAGAEHAARLAIPLWRSRAVVLVTGVKTGELPRLLQRLAESLHVADQRMHTALNVAELHGALSLLERSELVQRALFAISDLAGSDRDMPELLKGIHAIVGTLMYAENFFIVRLDVERQMMRFLYFVDVVDPPQEGEFSLREREGTLTWYVLNDAKPLRGDMEQLSSQVSGPLHIVGTDSYDWLGVPMLRDGIVEGALVVQSYEPGIVYSADDQELLQFVGNHILTALERKRNQDDLERSVGQRTNELAAANRGLQLEIVERERAERLQAALFQIAQLATDDITEDAFHRSIHQVVGQLLNASNFYIALLSDDRQLLAFPYFADARFSGQPPARPLGRGVSEYVLRYGKPLLADSAGILNLAHRGEIVISAGPLAVCWLGVPLVFADEAVGLVAVQSYDPEVIYGPADQELLGFVASQIANSLSRRRAAQIQQQAYAQLEQRVQERTRELRHEIAQREHIQEQLKHQVMHDALTGLPNRGYLRDRLERVLAMLKREPHRQCALLYLDIDRFKVINDSLGHLAGDAFLKAVTQRLLACVREPDLVARLSGDEFAILLEDVQIPATAVRVAQRILEGLGAPLLIAGKELEPSASIGIAIADDTYHLADEVLRDADMALYRAKALGRKRFELFDPSLQKHAVDVLTMEGELRTALHEDQFVPYFQPIICLDKGDVQGYEALIRWNHPVHGLIGPPEFLQIAEDSGHIEAIDWWMFEHSCALAARHFVDDRYVTINISPLHFKRPDLCARIREMLQRTGLAPSRLVIEVTERSLLDDPEGVRDILATLQAHGVGAAVDDFGTGYSSLSYLHTFPLRIVKIDRSFVARLGQPDSNNSEAVVGSILALARALGVDAVAEGIETQDQRGRLFAMGCQYGQGYLLGRPAPVEHWIPAGPAAE